MRGAMREAGLYRLAAALILAGGILLAQSIGASAAVLAIMLATGVVAAAAIHIGDLMLPEETVGAAATTVEPDGAASLAPPMPILPSLQLIANAIVEPLLLIHAGRVEMANPAAQSLLGDFIVGADVRSAIRHPAAIDRLGRDDPARDLVALDGLGRAGQRWSLAILPIGDGYTLAQLRDDSGRIAVERMRSDFVANASHELRTPLAAVLGYAETLRDHGEEMDAAARQRFLTTIADEARRLQSLVADLISISQIEASKGARPTTPVNLVDLCQSVVKDLTAAAPDRVADITITGKGAVPAVGDVVQLRQLVTNIIANAMRYGDAGTPIAVTITADPEDGDTVLMQVRDHGPGIAAEDIPRLTERFYRVDSARSRALGGTGLGLAIVRHIVERHRGQLGIASTLGEGTTVSVTLPRAQLP